MRTDGGHEQRVPVRGRFRDQLGTDAAAGAATIVDDDLLLESLAQELRERSRDNVGGSAGRKWNDEANRLVRISIRNRERQPCCAREQQQRRWQELAEYRQPLFRHQVLLVVNDAHSLCNGTASLAAR